MTAQDMRNFAVMTLDPEGKALPGIENLFEKVAAYAPHAVMIKL